VEYPFVILILLPVIVLESVVLDIPDSPTTVILESKEISEGTVMSIMNPLPIGFFIVNDKLIVVDVETVVMLGFTFESPMVIEFDVVTFSERVFDIS
jgi:hypothetical protein